MRAALAPALVLVLSTGCADEVVAPAPPELEPPLPPASPDAPGRYRIGVTTIEITDGEVGGRVLPVEIWYPATPAEGAERAHYQLKLGELVLADLQSPRGAVRDAPLDYRGAPHPVVVFSHGFGGTRLQSVYLTEYLASHGFVVAAPDHVGNTFADQINSAGAATALESSRVRPIDVSRTLDAVLAKSQGWPNDPLAFCCDETRVGIAGHSFGGFTALRIAGASVDPSQGDAVCAADPDMIFCDGWPLDEPYPASARDPRFIAALPQAPGGSELFQAVGLAEVAVPTMIQAGTLDTNTPYDVEAVAPFAALPPPAWLLTIEGAGHFTFSDMCELIEQVGLSAGEFDDGCSADNIPFRDAQTIIVRYATAFLQIHVAQLDDSAHDNAALLAPFAASGPTSLQVK